MRFPRLDFFTKGEGAAPSIIYASGSPSLSASPRLYKYLWQVFSRHSPYEGDAFFEHAPYVCTAHMLAEAERLVALGETCVVYGRSRPRDGEETPWDRTHPRYRNARFAPSWADDPDPVTVGGHK